VSKAALIAAPGARPRAGAEVRVNAVAPGIAIFPEDYDQATRKKLLDRTLLRRERAPGRSRGRSDTC